jgi:hypothetical protein
VAQFDDAIGKIEECRAVRDHEDGPLPHQPAERVQLRLFRLSVELGGGLVEEDDRCVAEKGTGDGDPLTLSP